LEHSAEILLDCAAEEWIVGLCRRENDCWIMQQRKVVEHLA
jgi:hypothetical protein